MRRAFGPRVLAAAAASGARLAYLKCTPAPTSAHTTLATAPVEAFRGFHATPVARAETAPGQKPRAHRVVLPRLNPDAVDPAKGYDTPTLLGAVDALCGPSDSALSSGDLASTLDALALRVIAPNDETAAAALPEAIRDPDALLRHVTGSEPTDAQRAMYRVAIQASAMTAALAKAEAAFREHPPAASPLEMELHVLGEKLAISAWVERLIGLGEASATSWAMAFRFLRLTRDSGDRSIQQQFTELASQELAKASDDQQRNQIQMQLAHMMQQAMRDNCPGLSIAGWQYTPVTVCARLVQLQLLHAATAAPGTELEKQLKTAVADAYRAFAFELTSNEEVAFDAFARTADGGIEVKDHTVLTRCTAVTFLLNQNAEEPALWASLTKAMAVNAVPEVVINGKTVTHLDSARTACEMRPSSAENWQMLMGTLVRSASAGAVGADKATLAPLMERMEVVVCGETVPAAAVLHLIDHPPKTKEELKAALKKAKEDPSALPRFN